MKKLKTCWISKKLRVQNCIIENKGNDFNFSKNENHMRNEKMERIINIEDSVIKHSHQDTVSHILVVHQWQVCLMHNLIRVWFSNSFLQILFSSYLISLSFNQLFATKIRSISISSPCHFYFVLYCFIDFSWSPLPLRSAQSRCPPDILCPCIFPYQSS